MTLSPTLDFTKHDDPSYSLTNCTTPTVLTTSTHVPGPIAMDGSLLVWANNRNFGDPISSALQVTATSIVWIEAGNIWKHAK